MSLKAVLFDFNGAIINDQLIHEQLIKQILIEENLILQPGEHWQVCRRRSARTCLLDLLARRGRVVNDTYLTKLLNRKAKEYALQIEKIEKLPLYAGLDDLIFQLQSRGLKSAIVSDAFRLEIEVVLNRSQLAQYFKVIVAGDDITTSKELDGYRLALERLNQEYPDLNLQPQECLAVEDTPSGVKAAKKVNMQVVGVANTYPFHMLQRCCNWTVDYLSDLELERVLQVEEQKSQ